MTTALPLSVVIPTRDRVRQLRKTLDTVFGEPEAERVEVVVVNDGSTDGTRDLLDSGRYGDRLRSVELEKSGPAVARNRGIELSRSNRVLLLGDDTRPAPGALGLHSSEREFGLQGRIVWEPSEVITPVMEFLAPSGPQFYFDDLVDGKPIPFTAVLGSNLSAKREWFVEEPLDEGFPAAAFEDTEMAYRFEKRGWKVLFGEQAVCFHDHLYESLTPFLSKQTAAGLAARRALALHPGMFASVIARPLIFDLWRSGSSMIRRMYGGESEQAAWWRASRRAFWRGFLGRGRATLEGG